MKKMILLSLMCAASGAFAQKKTDFTGTYRVNEEKVNWGPAPKFILPRYIKVEQQKDRVIIARTALNQQLQEQVPVVDTILFNGAVFNKKNANGTKTESSLKWNDDKSFVLTRKSVGADGELSGSVTEIWSLEDGGKTLFVDRDIHGRVNYQTKAYFNKQ